MKYIITESKLNKTIEKFIFDTFPKIHKVYFSSNRVVLGSTDGFPTITETVINVILDNSDNELRGYQLDDLSREIKETVDGFFNLKYKEYGSGWSFEFKQLAVVTTRTVLSKIN